MSDTLRISLAEGLIEAAETFNRIQIREPFALETALPRTPQSWTLDLTLQYSFRPEAAFQFQKKTLSYRSHLLAAEVQFHPGGFLRQPMIQTVLAINGQDCMVGDGNTTEELEAIAVTLLRVAEAIRNREEGAIECVGRDGRMLAYAHVHHCGPTCNLEGSDVATIEHLSCLAADSQPLHAISRSMIDEYRRRSAQ